MLPKPEKFATKVTSYRPISLVPVLSKLFEKLLLKRPKPILESKQITLTDQFGFRHKHSTIDQVHRITTLIVKTLEEKQVCSTVFLEVTKAFDKVWPEGLFHKFVLPTPRNTVRYRNPTALIAISESNRKMSTADSTPLRLGCRREVC
jgi:hypothetical protein